MLMQKDAKHIPAILTLMLARELHIAADFKGILTPDMCIN
jgi:hypothetical protein